MLSIGIIAAWKNSGKAVSPFKKGPDYIDAGWLALAAGRPCYNLDTFLANNTQVLQSFQTHSSACDIAVIEGNRGLYDGIDIKGQTSTAEIAKLLNAPVVLCIDCTKTSRTMAAAVSGCIGFDPEVTIKGVILNRVAGLRHENILRKSIEHYCGIPVLGTVPKLKNRDFPERHMGLVPTHEHSLAKQSIDAAARIASRNINLDTLAEIANQTSAEEVEVIEQDRAIDIPHQTSDPLHSLPRIGIIKDSAFQFYYPDNIAALQEAGAETVFISPLKDSSLISVDALYIGGGFPETHAQKLAENSKFRNDIKTMAEKGLPIYAECGGLIYLGEKLLIDEKSYTMSGVLPIVFGLSKKPQAHGYTIVTVDRENPYFEVGTEIRGHEFHYSSILEWRGNDKDMVFCNKRGIGIKNNRDGICYKNVLASYTHLHALGMPQWADSVVRNAILYKNSKKGSTC